MKKAKRETLEQSQPLVYGLIGLTIGLLVAGGFGAYTNHRGHRDIMDHIKNSGQRGDGHMDMSMNEMSRTLKNKTGDQFDKAFLEMMIAHHQGAINMAELSADRAEHDEIKRLSQAIISAQTEEIKDMEQWLRDWGYESPAGHMMY